MPELLDLTPRFQTFYALAQHQTPGDRWALWREHYGFAAVPPTPEGQAAARRLLDGAWDRYATLPAALDGEVQRLSQQASAASRRLEALFGTGTPPYRLVTFVGDFQGNAFVAGDSLCMPVEMPASWAAPILTHELTHLFHHSLSGGAGEWRRPLAALIVEEGLACRTVAALHPEVALDLQVGEPSWLQACERHQAELLADARSLLASDDDETLLRFLQPHPTLGLERTAYALGWWLVGAWLARGNTLAELARVPAAELPALVGHWLDQWLEQGPQ
ncbi:hypothetical protein [Deinococcus aquaedulcis]|uniref:hypothetical protein n=1 Tax=Deinococcus aquaedulcis TaxID=2840455 RepID=UPI001C83A2A3|nr:hypothetical protein [Deinococcus aquaedulcis]